MIFIPSSTCRPLTLPNSCVCGPKVAAGEPWIQRLTELRTVHVHVRVTPVQAIDGVVSCRLEFGFDPFSVIWNVFERVPSSMK